MSATASAAIAALEQIFAREHEQAVLPVVVYAFHELFGHEPKVSTLSPENATLSPNPKGTAPISFPLYRFRLDLSDIDRSVYETLDFRLALHPSETHSFLLTRMIAYALNVEPGLEFSPGGLSEPEDPCLSSEDPRGGKKLWIEVGNPSARRLHKAAKAAKTVKVYTYKNPDPLMKEIQAEKVHNAEAIEIFALAPDFLAELESRLARDNAWSILRDQESLMITVGEETIQGDLRRAQ